MGERTRHGLARAQGTADTCFTRSGAAWSEVTALGDDAYRIRLGGLLRATWMIGVCRELALRQVSIERAHARRLAHDGSWIAELHVTALTHEAQPPRQDPLDLPLISFAEQNAADGAEPETLVLRDYELTPSNDHGGTLHLILHAQDSVGLLGSLLAAFASLALLPVEMHIETRGAQAHDSLWLATTHAQDVPDEEDFRALHNLLARAVQH